MGKYDKKYEAFKLFPKPPEDKKKPLQENLFAEETYYEIEYDSVPMPGVGKFVLKSQKIEAQKKDEVRELFNRMREISRKSSLAFYDNSKFYNKRVRQENSQIFYKQGMFMKDFEDEYKESVPYADYFPYYQRLGYGQLRTYFTWRTKVRKGQVEDTSLSYAYLYLYELINNIGVADPKEGLDRLLFFWKSFRVYQPSVDKYVLRWLKDYHIYYELPWSFPEFVAKNNLAEWYPNLTDSEDAFTLFCTFSKYDIKKSVFYTKDKKTLIEDCFRFTIDRLTKLFAEHGIDFDGILFPPMKGMSLWTPFQDALFYPWQQQRDRRVVLSAKEVYVCSGNRWTFSRALASESGRQLAGYILKQMESVLRQAVSYKYKITAGLGMVHPATVKKLADAGIALEQSITGAVTEFYREATKTVVTVDRDALAKIRREALLTQEKLIVPEEEENASVMPFMEKTPPKSVEILISAPLEPEEANPWNELKTALSRVERDALLLALNGDKNIRQFADDHGIMLEVLSDGINEKAVDFVGDSLLDDEFMIYEDYIDQVKEMMEQ